MLVFFFFLFSFPSLKVIGSDVVDLFDFVDINLIFCLFVCRVLFDMFG